MDHGRRANRVLAIGLDAAEPELIDRLIEHGALPHLKRLGERGASGRLTSSAQWLAGSPWATFYTGTSPAEHGFYHCLQWRGQQMGLIRPGSQDLNPQPFWRDLGKVDRRVIALDVPMALPPAAFDGREIAGWGTHDQLAPPVSHPPQLLAEIREACGDLPMREESFAPQSLSELMDLRDELIQTTERTVQAAEMLLSRQPWDFLIVGFSALHRGGHRLWDHTGVRDEASDRDAKRQCQEALQELYVACDSAVGRLLDAAGWEGYQLVFSLHGMGPNTCRVDVLPELLNRILGQHQAAANEPKLGWKARVSRLVPQTLREAIKRQLPQSMRDRITTYYRLGQTDWSQTQAFSMIADLQGYVRINLAGREAEGIVSPGSQYDALCNQISEGLASFVDQDTGEPIVEQVLRTDGLFEPGAHSDNLPDLIVLWSPTPAAEHRAIESPAFGTIPWPTPHKMPDGRSGNHRPEGILYASGPGITPGTNIKGANILDLAPTIYHLLGAVIPDHMRDPIPSLAEPPEILHERSSQS